MKYIDNDYKLNLTQNQCDTLTHSLFEGAIFMHKNATGRRNNTWNQNN